MRVGGVGVGDNWGARHLDPPLGGAVGEGGVGVEPRMYNTRSDTGPGVNTVFLRVTFNERFVQCSQVLGTYLAVACLTKSSSHTSLVLTNPGLVVTKVGPTNSG